jgi:hypothetical protein
MGKWSILTNLVSILMIFLVSSGKYSFIVSYLSKNEIAGIVSLWKLRHDLINLFNQLIFCEGN